MFIAFLVIYYINGRIIKPIKHDLKMKQQSKL